MNNALPASPYTPSQRQNLRMADRLDLLAEDAEHRGMFDAAADYLARADARRARVITEINLAMALHGAEAC